MNPQRWLLKSKLWAKNPPSMKKVIFYASIIAACLAVAGLEFLFGWPEWLKIDSFR
jgi:hypothetical protein